MMYVSRDDKLYRTIGTWHPKLQDIIVYEKESDMPKWSGGMIYLEPTDLPPGFYRKRRNKLTRIPDEWVGRIPNPQTIRQRNTVSRRTRHK